MSKIEKLIDTVALNLEGVEPKSDIELICLVKAFSHAVAIREQEQFTEEELDEAVRTLKGSFVHNMKAGSLFVKKDNKPWLHLHQGQEWYYWKRYKKYLITKKRFPPKVVNRLEQTTYTILDKLEDPGKEGPWAYKGLVVGHVQSGKTANYTGLVSRAADVGYKVIIVLAGVLNSLRNQTQERLDSDFMGYCTKIQDYIGASEFHHGPNLPRKPHCLTSSIEDFNTNDANKNSFNLQSSKEPVVFVLKKNKSTLTSVYKWLKSNNRHDLKNHSMLMIDDEADHASINTSKDNNEPTAINLAIRDILGLFNRSALVGYTATPFANIFIDPESTTEMQNGAEYKDLFPEDFILSLEPPSNYFGANRIFTEGHDLDCIREISDNEDLLPLKHKIYDPVEALPQSLHEAIECYIVAKTVRALRGQGNRHHTMMINASRFTRIQNLLSALVEERIQTIRDAVVNYSALPEDIALQNHEINRLQTAWKREFSHLEFSWGTIQKQLKNTIIPITVLSVNSSNKKNRLDYDKYPEGRSVIAIGGLGLSRGLTLEGLLVSYFLRNSIMYDTLMQMGRWFGYRDGYSDLCRLYMTPEAEAWYNHIADATEELRDDFRKMEELDLTPLQFGLRVRSHPASLIVTARNKMRNGKKVPHAISLDGRLIETTVLPTDRDSLGKNVKATDRLIRAIQDDTSTKHERTKLGHLWKDVSLDYIKEYLRTFTSHPESIYTFYSDALISHLDLLDSVYSTGAVLVKTLVPRDDDPELEFGTNLTGRKQERKKGVDGKKGTVAITDHSISFKVKSRIGESEDESAGIDPAELEAIRKTSGKGTINPKKFRAAKSKKPLLIIHPLKIALEGEPPVVAYGISFPGTTHSRNVKRLVEYVVNVPYFTNHYGESCEDEGEVTE